jgi:hypothetical protein
MGTSIRGTLKVLEPYDGKLSRTVLRGKGAVRLLTYPVFWRK